MKKAKKIIAMVLTSLCVLGVPMIAFAGASTTATCPNCGRTAYYSGSYERYKTTTVHNHSLDSGITVPCTISQIGYEDMYRCTCNLVFGRSRTEVLHEYISSN